MNGPEFHSKWCPFIDESQLGIKAQFAEVPFVTCGTTMAYGHPHYTIATVPPHALFHPVFRAAGKRVMPALMYADWCALLEAMEATYKRRLEEARARSGEGA